MRSEFHEIHEILWILEIPEILENRKIPEIVKIQKIFQTLEIPGIGRGWSGAWEWIDANGLVPTQGNLRGGVGPLI